ncbi:xanthomonadin biosynthesis protein, partial [Xanthomonas campestris pv. raphani]
CTPANSPKRRPPTHLLHHGLTPELSRAAKRLRLE